MKILLGSQSPRRKEILSKLDIHFKIVDISCDEDYPEHLQGGEIPLYISKEKAEAYRHQLQADELLITADTIVWVDGQVLGKPKTEEEAYNMLRILSDKTHQVYTGVCFTTQTRQTAYYDTTDVSFGKLSEEDINYYVSKYHPLDKAGAYGIQEWIGCVGCVALNGSYFNVMGLPIHLVAQTLKDFGLSEQ